MIGSPDPSWPFSKIWILVSREFYLCLAWKKYRFLTGDSWWSIWWNLSSSLTQHRISAKKLFFSLWIFMACLLNSGHTQNGRCITVRSIKTLWCGFSARDGASGRRITAWVVGGLSLSPSPFLTLLFPFYFSHSIILYFSHSISTPSTFSISLALIHLPLCL